MMVVVLQKIEMAPVTLPPNVLTKEVNLVEVVPQGLESVASSCTKTLDHRFPKIALTFKVQDFPHPLLRPLLAPYPTLFTNVLMMYVLYVWILKHLQHLVVQQQHLPKTTLVVIHSLLRSQGTSKEICGENSGQHIYYELGKDTGASATLSFTFSTATAVASTTRSFEIKVTQIPCYAENRPPSGCLQYHEGLTGRITNFNWGATASANQVHLANQNQQVCIRQNEGYCCIRYSLCDFAPTTITAMGHMQPSWRLDSSADIVGNAANSVDTGTVCTNDYVEIAGATNQCEQGFTGHETSRLCGLQFGAVGSINMQMFAISNICSCNTFHSGYCH